MNKNPKISVILSVYNHQNSIKRTVKSVLNQSFKNFEFIIINDASSDSSLEILKKIKDKRIKIISNKYNLGLSKSLNKGIGLACGEYIARMDADDVCLPERLVQQLNFLEKNPGISFCGSNVWLVDKTGRRIKKTNLPLNYRDVQEKSLSFCPFIHPTLFFKTEILKQEMYNPDFIYAQDYDLVLRLLKKYKGENIDKLLLLYTVGQINKLKKQQFFALKARWQALTRGDYQFYEIYKLIKPLISFFLPARINILIYHNFFWS